jgi:8-oxo-dGTP diphosphatase
MLETILQFGDQISGVDYVLRPGGYLVVRNSKSAIAVVATTRGYFLPGGGIEAGESAEQAAVREANEECGLSVVLKDSLGTADEFVFSGAEGLYYRKRCSFFSADFVSCNGDGEPDHRLMWMSVDEAVSRLSHKSQVWAVKINV